MSVLRDIRLIPAGLVRELRTLTLHGAGARGPCAAVVSVLLAVAVADMLELDDLSWAAFSGFMVMRASVSEAAARGAMRVLGTVAGAAGGVLVAPAVANSPALLIAALFGASWVGIFGALEGRRSYAWVFFGVTAGLVVTQTLADPADVLEFAATRVAEVGVGTGACVLVAALFSGPALAAPGAAALPAREPVTVRAMWTEEWLQARWPLLRHATRSALAVALLPLIWRWFGIEDFAQTAVTSFVVMIVPAAAVRERRHNDIFTRMAHRAIGCLLGSAAALACLALFGTALVPCVLVLGAGVWVGYHVQNGGRDVSYVGTQFTLGLLVTLVQGPGPVTDITPGLERFAGILIGIAALCLVTVAWPLERAEAPAA